MTLFLRESGDIRAFSGSVTAGTGTGEIDTADLNDDRFTRFAIAIGINTGLKRSGQSSKVPF